MVRDARRRAPHHEGLPVGQIKAHVAQIKVQSSRKKYSFSQRPQIKIKCGHPVPQRGILLSKAVQGRFEKALLRLRF
jgi:hypothetical protein